MFHKIDDALTADAFKNVFKEKSSELLMSDVLKIATVHKYICF